MTHTPAAAGGSGNLIEENFDGTGTPSGWTDANSPNWDYATSPAPLAGTQSWRGTASTITSIYNLGADYDDLHVYFVAHMVNATTESGFSVFRLLNSSDGVVAYMVVRGDPATRFANGTIESGNETSIQNQTRHIWIRYQKGTGSNGVTTWWISATATKPGSPTGTVTNGDATTAARKVMLRGNTASSGGIVFDNLVVSTSTIGSDPL